MSHKRADKIFQARGKLDLSVRIGSLKLKNPVMVASGTFGYAEEFKGLLDLGQLGAIVTKTITLRPRKGNPPPRTCETPAGMLNSIGLENLGIEVFLQEKLPFLIKTGVPIIVSIASEGSSQEFIELAKRLDKIKELSAIELNVSCPNISSPQSTVHSQQIQKDKDSSLNPKRPKLISQDPDATYEVVRAVRRVSAKTLITKLSPNVTDIAEVALAAENAGSDSVSLINTVNAMAIDVKARRPKIAAVTAGLSGPAIRPIAVRAVWEVYQKIKIPIIGIGGIIDTLSALEFFLAGASVVAVGTGNFINPRASLEIISGLKKYMLENNILSISGLRGALKL